MIVSQYPIANAPNTQGLVQASFLDYAYLIDTGGLEPQAGSSVTITLPYNPSLTPANPTPADLEISYYDGTNWVILTPIAIDTVNNTVTVVTDHFSWWAVVAKFPTATPVPNEIISHPEIYPNPYKGQGEIHLPMGLTQAGDVKVEVYTTSFREIRTLEYSQVPAGGEVTWDGTDKAGANLSNGIYYLRITTPQGHWTLKLLILR